MLAMELRLDTKGFTIRIREGELETTPKPISVIASMFAGILRRAQRKKKNRYEAPSRIFAISLADIEKALAPKKVLNLRKILPKHYYKHLKLFDYKNADKLPPYRLGIDHSIKLEKDTEGREKIVP